MRRSILLRLPVLLVAIAPGCETPAASGPQAAIGAYPNVAPGAAELLPAPLEPERVLAVGKREERPPRVVGALRLSNGSVVMADATNAKLIYLDAEGATAKTVDVGAIPSSDPLQIQQLLRVSGDTVALIASSTVALLFDEAGVLIARFNAHEIADGAPPGLRAVLAVPATNLAVIGVLNPMVERKSEEWVDSMDVVTVDSELHVLNTIGRLPAVHGARTGEQYKQVWFAPVATHAATATSFIHGFGDAYVLHRYSLDGAPQTPVSREWTPSRITDADIETFIAGWGSNWIKGSAGEMEEERRAMRKDPFFGYVPAFSQVLVGADGRLWVRSPNLIDAQADGELNRTPLEASTWNIFNADGEWVANATLPPLFRPTDIGSDYILGVATSANGPTLVSYRLPH